MVHLRKTICTISNEVDAPVLVVRVNIHEMNRLIPHKEGDDHNVAIVDKVLMVCWTHSVQKRGFVPGATASTRHDHCG